MQVIAVVTNDWNIYLLDHTLKLLWKSSLDKVSEKANHKIVVTIIISPHPIQNSDSGVVIIAKFPSSHQFNREDLTLR